MKNTLLKFTLILTTLFGNSPLMADTPENSMPHKTETAIVAAGCFWCIQKPMDHLKGVLSTSVGYIGGTSKNANYKNVSAGGTSHYEALKIVFDPSVVTYKQIMDVFWRNIDPHNAIGQFCDKGDQYRAAIFYLNKTQKEIAIDSKDRIQLVLHKPIVTEILSAGMFYDGENYHQKYYEKNPIRYKYYRYSCGRDQRLKDVWGK